MQDAPSTSAAPAPPSTPERLEALLAQAQDLCLQVQAELEIREENLYPDLPDNAVTNDEFFAYKSVHALSSLFGEEGALSKAVSTLKARLNDMLYARMEETKTPSRTIPGVATFYQTSRIYPGLDERAIADMNISRDEAQAMIVEWIKQRGWEKELIDTKPRVVWQRAGAKEFVPQAVADGEVIPAVMRIAPKLTVAIRKA